MEIKDIFFNKSLSKISFRHRSHSLLTIESWCQRKRWHHLPYMTHID